MRSFTWNGLRASCFLPDLAVLASLGLPTVPKRHGMSAQRMLVLQALNTVRHHRPIQLRQLTHCSVAQLVMHTKRVQLGTGSLERCQGFASTAQGHVRSDTVSRRVKTPTANLVFKSHAADWVHGSLQPIARAGHCHCK